MFPFSLLLLLLSRSPPKFPISPPGCSPLSPLCHFFFGGCSASYNPACPIKRNNNARWCLILIFDFYSVERNQPSRGNKGFSPIALIFFSNGLFSTLVCVPTHVIKRISDTETLKQIRRKGEINISQIDFPRKGERSVPIAEGSSTPPLL